MELSTAVLQHLQCGCCKEVLKNTLMISVCSHNFCSECLRGWMQVSKKHECPLCLAQFQSSHLVSNRIVDTVVRALKSCPRGSELEVAEDFEPSPSCKAGINRVECPSCHSLIASTDINRHLDNCLETKAGTFQSPNSQRSIDDSLQSTGARPPRRFLPNLVFSSAKDSFVKKLLSKYNLPTHGKRQEQEKRWKQFHVVFNANQDALVPLPDSELVKQVIAWEKSLENWSTRAKKRPQDSKSTSHEALIREYREKTSKEFGPARPKKFPRVEKYLPDPWRKTLTTGGTPVYYNPDTHVATCIPPKVHTADTSSSLPRGVDDSESTTL